MRCVCGCDHNRMILMDACSTLTLHSESPLLCPLQPYMCFVSRLVLFPQTLSPAARPNFAMLMIDTAVLLETKTAILCQRLHAAGLVPVECPILVVDVSYRTKCDRKQKEELKVLKTQVLYSKKSYNKKPKAASQTPEIRRLHLTAPYEMPRFSKMQKYKHITRTPRLS